MLDHFVPTPMHFTAQQRMDYDYHTSPLLSSIFLGPPPFLAKSLQPQVSPPTFSNPRPSHVEL